MAKVRYKTKQMTELVNYLKSIQGQHVTVQEINKYFKDREIAVGTTTIYRQLEKMVKEGFVTKYMIEGSDRACFEYIGEDKSSEYKSSYHCKCEKCGKLIHIHCREVENLSRHMTEYHEFQLNPKRTVFYGICNECRENENLN